MAACWGRAPQAWLGSFIVTAQNTLARIWAGTGPQTCKDAGASGLKQRNLSKHQPFVSHIFQ